MQHNGQTTAEIQEEVALTNLETVSTVEKRQSNTDKFHFLRADLQTITTLGKVSLAYTRTNTYRSLSRTHCPKWRTFDLSLFLWVPINATRPFLILRFKRLLTTFCYVSFMCPLEKLILMRTHQWSLIDKRYWVGEFTADGIAQGRQNPAATVIKGKIFKGILTYLKLLI